ncbi:GUN4 domain-containing protein [Nostoc punctiforme]|uniref:GUN4 domain protein n=1 Tax=Nostoc punctiforme (strain ATCC 29133 / PCC 73102) TaxID=63737 RepID=B2J9K0_NOSP7|nr:GUN4 domain-containing protein [Nostoc punctiforme]ACC81027.1 GUN4 domain protein [Nostoc punctiforme PCC 73102]
MLTKQQRQLITYKTISIYERTYQLPVLKNTAVKVVQKKIRERQRLIKEGIRYHHQLGGIIKRKEEISQEEIFEEIQLFIKDYSHIIDFLDNYKDNYHNFLLNLADDLKELFKQKYLAIKNLEDERSKLEQKNHQNPKILDELTWEKQENLKAVLLLSNAYFLILEKIKLLGEGIKNLAEDTKNQKRVVQQIVKDLEVYQEIYEYQRKAYKIRQEIAKIAHTAINFENSLQDYFSPFQSLIDEVIKVDEYFYATVGDIKNLGDNILKYQSNLFNLEKNEAISETFLDFMVTSYEKKARLKDAFIQSQLLDWQIHNFDLSENGVFLDKGIDLISNYISKQLTDQRKALGIAEVNFVSTDSLSPAEEIGLIGLTNNNVTLPKKFPSNKGIDYTQLRDLLAQHQWKEADIETTKIMLKVMNKNYWNEVYKEDIDNFSCQDLHTIDQLWDQYSYGYFGFTVQQTIWSEMGGQVDYETEKRLGDRLGWRKEGNWLDYEQLTFKLSPMTPMGHLPAQWLHYDQHSFDLSPKSSTEHLSMGAWRVKSWLVWQMHLFFSSVKNCNETFLCGNRTFIKNRKN